MKKKKHKKPTTAIANTQNFIEQKHTKYIVWNLIAPGADRGMGIMASIQRAIYSEASTDSRISFILVFLSQNLSLQDIIIGKYPRKLNTNLWAREECSWSS